MPNNGIVNQKGKAMKKLFILFFVSMLMACGQQDNCDEFCYMFESTLEYCYGIKEDNTFANCLNRIDDKAFITHDERKDYCNLKYNTIIELECSDLIM